MNVYRVKTGSILPLGKQGENLVRQIQFDLSRWISTFGPGTVQLLHQRSGDETPYPVAVEQEGDCAVWTVTNADTAAAGTGRAELQYYVGDALAKSETWMTKVLPAIGPASETPPEAQQGWVDQVLQAGTVATEAADRAEEAAVRQPYPNAETGTWWVWNAESGAYEDTGISYGTGGSGGGVTDHEKLTGRDKADQHPMIAITGLEDALAGKQPTGTYLTEETDPTVPDWAKQPEKPSYTADEVGAMSSETLPEAINTALAQAKESGEFDGAAGQDGVSPTVTVIDITGGHRVTITDANGTKYFDVMDGKDGSGGGTGGGADGADGFSPIVSITQIEGGHRVTITDANGEKPFDVLDGVDGQDGSPGVPGQDGSPGKDGEPGADGVSVVSVEQTTTSTEDGGTNVVTVTKTDGTTSTFYVRNGSRGSTGPAGSDGQDGVSPIVSVSEITGGHRVSIQDADGTSSFDVMDGQDGKDGQSGAAGADGITPTIGANGNWYLGDTDTGKPSRGETGPQGTAGPQGETGQTGAAGYTPVRGTDYWTAADQQAIVDAVLAALPAAEGVSV